MVYYLEKYGPIVLSIFGAYYYYYTIIIDENSIDRISTLLNLMVTISSTLLGFLLTIVTIINTISTRRMKFIKEAGEYPKLMRYLNVCLYSNLLVLCISVANSFISIGYNQVKFTGYIFCVLWAIISSIRFTYIFVTVMHEKE